jgi:hypothetical protein
MTRILLLATILLIGFQSYSQKDTTMLVWYDTNVTWVMHVQNDYGGDYKIIATARPAEGKKLNGVAGMIINLWKVCYNWLRELVHGRRKGCKEEEL